MGTLIALRNLAFNKTRTLTAVGGICFSVTLLFIQLGFFSSLLVTATRVYDSLDFDLLLTSPSYVSLTETATFPQARLLQAVAHSEVNSAYPVHVTRLLWRNPVKRSHHAILILGVTPSDPVTTLPELAELLPILSQPDTVLVDRLSRKEVGVGEVGVTTEIGPHQVKTVGSFALGPGFDNGVLVVSDLTFSRLRGGSPISDVSLGLIKLRPGTDSNQVAHDLRLTLPADVRVLTRGEINAQERYYWIVRTSIGLIFGSGVIVAILFGVVIIYQVLSLEVSHRLSEYATLKALGFSDNFVAGVVLRQALIIAGISYFVAFVLAMAVYTLSSSVTNLPVAMTLERAVGVLVTTLVMCLLSGLFALTTLRRADPVELFP